MTERPPVFFNAYSKGNSTGSTGTAIPYDILDIISGDGTYSTSTRKYTIQNAGIYLVGFSYMTATSGDVGRAGLVIERSGTLIFQTTTQFTEPNTQKNLNITGYSVISVVAGDRIWLRVSGGNPRVNASSYSENGVIKNSFWAIRINRS